MSIYDKLTIHHLRTFQKDDLGTYFSEDETMYDNAIDKLITELKKERNYSQELFDGWADLMINDPELYKQRVEEAERYEHSIDHQQEETIIDVMETEEQLLALVEMKIIYSFKQLEINIKKLLRNAFSLSSTRDFDKWEFLLRFLKDKNIIANNFDRYQDLLALRKANNIIKHADEYEENLSSVSEFKNQSVLTYSSLETFYERVKGVPNKFLEFLKDAIYKELYEFSDLKLQEIADTLVLRMEQPEADKLISMIQKRYQ